MYSDAKEGTALERAVLILAQRVNGVIFSEGKRGSIRAIIPATGTFCRT
jgi:hypothetical protein